MGAEPASRAVLRRVERERAETGNENRGFLSIAQGFLPTERPRLALPESHRAWDDLARELPALWRAVSVREAVEAMPVLDADELPEEDLWRASCLMSIVAHSYVRAELRPYDSLPPSVREPWDAIARRLDRPRAFLSYNDLITYNWRLLDPDRPNPMRVENLDLLVPTVGNQEERVFYLTQVEIAAQCAPLVDCVVRAQEAALRRDRGALEEELLLVLERLRHVTEVSFHKIDQNPLSATHVDPVVWANTVAPFAVPIEADVTGPSGTAAALFHLLDLFFERRGNSSLLGREMLHLREWFPPAHREFLAAVAETPVGGYVRESGSRGLRALYSSVLDAYAGPRGYLGTHRLKVYGFLELAFKVGRQVTIGGFSGAFRDRAWKQVDGELSASRSERYDDLPPTGRTASLRAREAVAPGIDRVVLDISEAGLPYRPGDHCRVLPENAPDLVERTLVALRARGDEVVPLTGAWREAIRHRPAHEDGVPDRLPLADFLRFAKLRPLTRPVAKALLEATGSERLDAILEARGEDQLELWEALDLLAEEGYEPRRLWRSELWHTEAIARVVPPEPFRTYSVSSAPDSRVSSSLDLTVGRLAYDGRRGTASTYLTEGLTEGTPVAVDAVRPVRFALPADPSTPVVMFAGGTGIAPFRSFLGSRDGSGENWLFAAARTAEDLCYRDELEALAAAGRVQLRVAFSRAPEGAARLPQVIAAEENAAELWRLLRPRSHGGAGAVFYVCGRGAFSAAVRDALEQVAARFVGDDEARRLLRRLTAERRFLQDVFTTAAAQTAPGVAGDGSFDVSDLVLRNDDEHGYWLAVDGNVYDVSEFVHLHPGGPAILRESAGIDASREYRAVLHHEHSEVDSLLPMYKIGSLRRLRFGTSWGVALVQPEGVAYVPLRDLFRSWVRYLYLVVEMENASRHDFSYLRRPLTTDDDPAELNTLKLQYTGNTHARFVEAYFDGTLGDELRRLFALTAGLCAPHERTDRLGRDLAQVFAGPDARRFRELSSGVRSAYRTLAADDPRAAQLCSLLEEHDGRFLRELKLTLRDGMLVFEELEDRAAADGGDRLVSCLMRVPGVARRYCKGLSAAFAETGLVL